MIPEYLADRLSGSPKQQVEEKSPHYFVGLLLKLNCVYANDLQDENIHSTATVMMERLERPAGFFWNNIFSCIIIRCLNKMKHTSVLQEQKY
jgi:hypothetical protein